MKKLQYALSLIVFSCYTCIGCKENSIQDYRCFGDKEQVEANDTILIPRVSTAQVFFSDTIAYIDITDHSIMGKYENSVLNLFEGGNKGLPWNGKNFSWL